MATARGVWKRSVPRGKSSGHGAWRLETLGLAQQFQWPRRVASGKARLCAAIPVATARGVWKHPGTPGHVWHTHCSMGWHPVIFLSAMCKVLEFWASTSSVESRGFRGTVAALTPSPHWVPCPTERRAVAYTYYTLDTWLTGKRIGAYTFYTLDTVAHGAARVPLHPRGPCAGGWPYAGTSAFRLLGDQSAATQVACAGPREALQNTPHSEQHVPTSLFLPLPRPCVSAHAA